MKSHTLKTRNASYPARAKRTSPSAQSASVAAGADNQPTEEFRQYMRECNKDERGKSIGHLSKEYKTFEQWKRERLNGYAATNMTFYAVLYESLRKSAHELGYALTLHGSLKRDLDVVAIPWTESASSVEWLVKALTQVCGGLIEPGNKFPVTKPHGRLAWEIQLCGPGGRYVDLSVIPPSNRNATALVLNRLFDEAQGKGNQPL